MVIALFFAIAASIAAGILHARFREGKFSPITAIVYLLAMNILYMAYMLYFKRESFTPEAYFGFPKALLRYAAFQLGLCAALPVAFSAITAPKRMLYAFRELTWLKIAVPAALVLSAGTYGMYKYTPAADLPVEAPIQFSSSDPLVSIEPLYPAEPVKTPDPQIVATDSKGYIDVSGALSELGYTKRDGVYYKDFPQTKITFDLTANRAYKNDFYYNIGGLYTQEGDKLYISPQALSDILGMKVEYQDGKADISPIEQPAHYWTGLCAGLIAHATGGIDNKDYPDCYEALVKNYNLGHRVFEMDFNLTTDGKLVVVHDWSGYSGPMSWQKFMALKIWGVYTTMDIDKVTDILAVNPDMYVVTDTKSFDYNDADTLKQFDLIIQSARRYGDDVLNRIIPQIYDQHMYDLLESEYRFPSIIYTLYESPDNDGQVTEFVAKHDDIKAVTMAPVRFSDGFCQKLTVEGKLIYLFTLNDLAEVRSFKARGAWGFYTDFITPSDMECEC